MCVLMIIEVLAEGTLRWLGYEKCNREEVKGRNSA